ncbi:MAG TPA: hypothetical protein VLS45_08085 [Methylomicrobium sp.]|nr:hypothetical protein [Methylomicrobium sp.]
MEHAKKLILIEPRVLEQLQQHREYKEIEKPTDKKTKAGLSVELQNVLMEDGESDDVKAKMYQQMFNRFMKMSDKMPESTMSSINSTAPRQSTSVRTPRTSRRRRRLNWTQY